MVHQRNRKILSQRGFIGSFDAFFLTMWSQAAKGLLLTLTMLFIRSNLFKSKGWKSHILARISRIRNDATPKAIVFISTKATYETHLKKSKITSLPLLSILISQNTLGRTFPLKALNMLPAGRYRATTKTLPLLLLARAMPSSFVSFHTTCVKCPVPGWWPPFLKLYFSACERKKSRRKSSFMLLWLNFHAIVQGTREVVSSTPAGPTLRVFK